MADSHLPGRIVLLAATRRGLLVTQKIFQLFPQAKFIVFTFKETPEEPPFVDDIALECSKQSAEFFVSSNVNHEKWTPLWDNTPIELMLVISWRFMISPKVYSKPAKGTYVFHDSQLPCGRGFAPSPWAIIKGSFQTAASLIHISENVDEGDIVDQVVITINDDDSIADLMSKVTQAYITMTEKNFARLISGNAASTPQQHALATYNCKRLPADNLLDFRQPSKVLLDLIRGSTHPYPGAFCYIQESGVRLVVWKASRIVNQKTYFGSVPGRVVEILDSGVKVLTGDGEILIELVQTDSFSQPVPARSILNKFSVTLSNSVSPEIYLSKIATLQNRVESLESRLSLISEKLPQQESLSQKD